MKHKLPWVIRFLLGKMFVEWLAATQEPLLNGQKKMKEEKSDWGIGRVPSLNLTVNIVSQSSGTEEQHDVHTVRFAECTDWQESNCVWMRQFRRYKHFLRTSVLLCCSCDKRGNFILFTWGNVELTHGFVLAPLTSSLLFVYWLSSKMCISFAALTWGSHHNIPKKKFTPH